MLLSDMKKYCITMVIPPDVSLMLLNARIESFYGFSVVGPLTSVAGNYVDPLPRFFYMRG